MTDPLNRRMIIALLAILPTFLFALASQAFNPPLQPVQTKLISEEIAALPGAPADAPLITTDLVPPEALDPDAMNRAREANLADPFFGGPIQPAVPFRFTGTYADRTNARDCLALAAMAEAEKQGSAAIRLNGRLVDVAHVKTAQQNLARARRLGMSV